MLVGCLAWGGSAQADEIRVIATGAVKHTVLHLAERFKAQTGHVVAASFTTAGGVTQRVEGGEAADLVVSSESSMAALGRKALVGAPAAPVGRVRIAVAVRQGAPAPDVASSDALKKTLLAAPSVSYADPKAGATTGIHFAKVLAQLGIADEVAAKSNLQKDGLDVMAEVAAGRAAIGVTQASEVKAVPGVTLVGYLPDAVQLVSVYAGALTPAGQAKPAAAAFLALLTGPDGQAEFRAAGFDVP
jgi:molybdate transport system substrate-binding protein